MKKLLIFALVAASAMTMNAQPEQMSEEDMAQRRSEMIQNKAEKLASNFGLKDDAKTQFVDLYKQYQTDLEATQEKPNKPDGQKAQKGADKEKKSLTDEEATAKVNEYFERQEKQISQMQKKLDVEKKYYEKFKKTLTPQQLARLFRENRMRFGGQQGQRGQMQMNGQRGMMNDQRGGFGGGPQGGFGGPGGGFGGPGF